MAKLNGIYKCDICGNVVEVLTAGNGELVCCGQPMKLFKEKTSEQEGNEKHVPVIEAEGNKVKVNVGSVPHPMEKKPLHPANRNLGQWKDNCKHKMLSRRKARGRVQP